MPKVLKGYPNLMKLNLDATDAKEYSMGSIIIDSPTLRSVSLRAVGKSDDWVRVSEKCEKLKDFSMINTRKKQLELLAPNVERVHIEGLNEYDPADLIIAADNGYLLHLQRTVVHIENCKGVGKLVIDDNWSGERDPFTADKKPNAYSNLHYYEGRRQAQYHNAFFHNFALSAPRLVRLHLHFNEHLRFENEPGGDDILHIKHPNLEWVNLINGDEFFRGIKID